MTAIYAISGDPITFGHINIIERAVKVFDKVIVAIGNNPKKAYTFPLEIRADLARQALRTFDKIEVCPFRGLLVDYAYSRGASIIIRGVRSQNDFDYEYGLFHTNAGQNPNIDTFFIPAMKDKVHISSSTAKALQLEKGLIHEYVPLAVKQKLEEAISGQYLLGMTGSIACGKSFVADQFVAWAKDMGVEAHNIDMDDIGHEILSSQENELYQNVQQRVLSEIMSKNIWGPDSDHNLKIDRKELGELVFYNDSKMKKLNAIMHEPLLFGLRNRIYDKKGLIILNAALLAESGLSRLCNNNIVLVGTSPDIQRERLQKRGLTVDQVVRRISSQWDYETKITFLSKCLHDDGYGQIWVIDNSGKKDPISGTFTKVMCYFNLDQQK